MLIKINKDKKRVQIKNSDFKFAILMNGLLDQCKEVESFSIECPEYQKYFSNESIEPTHIIDYNKTKSTITPDLQIKYTSFGMYATGIVDALEEGYKYTAGKIDFYPEFNSTSKFILSDKEHSNLAVPLSEGLQINNIIYIDSKDPLKIDYVLDPNCRAVVAHTSDDMLYALLEDYLPYPTKGSYKLGISVRTPTSDMSESFFWPAIHDAFITQPPEHLKIYGERWLTREKYYHDFTKYITSLKK